MNTYYQDFRHFFQDKAVLFDMDGVIADSENSNLKSLVHLMAHHGVTITVPYLAQFSGITLHDALQFLIDRSHLSASVENLEEEFLEIREQLRGEEGIQPMPGCVALIKRLHQEGIPMAVASSSSMAEIRNYLSTFGILEYFDSLISGCDCRHSKPDPEIYLTAACALKTAPANCIVVEDSTNGMRAAKSAGMFCIGYVPPQSYTKDISHADMIIHHFDELSA